MGTYLVGDVRDLRRHRCSSFWNHKIFHEKWSVRELKLRKINGESFFYMTSSR